jgi:hypothetical protein
MALRRRKSAIFTVHAISDLQWRAQQHMGYGV